MLSEEIFEEHVHGMAKNDGIGDLHHRRLQVQREEHALRFGGGDLFIEKGNESSLAHRGCVENFAGFERGALLEDGDGTIGGHELDLHVSRGFDDDRLLIGGKIVHAHRGDVGLRIC